MAGAARTGSVAYITTSYPSLSHTFILREVLALRARGLEIHTISLRRTAGEHLLSKANRDASATTYAVRPPRWSEVLSVHVSALTRHPVSYLRTLREAQRLAREGWRGRLWQIFYFAEAVLVWRHCVRKRAGHIHAHHGSPAADVALLAAHFARGAGRGPATWSFTLHGPTEFWNVRWFRLAEKLRHAHAVVCISDFARSQAMALVAEEHWPKLHIVHCGLAAREHRATANVPALAAHILCVGRLVPEKGQAILLRALALLVNQGHAPTLTLVGSGQSQTALERLTGELGLAGRVTFAGAVGQDEIERYYDECELFCLPSFSEGLPVVLMEAMAYGRPVVSTHIAGVRELVRDGETGLLVAPGSAEELAGAIGRLLDDAELRERIADAGRECVRREFDVERSAGQLEQVFREVTGVKDEPEATDGPARPSEKRERGERPLSKVLVGSTVDRS